MSTATLQSSPTSCAVNRSSNDVTMTPGVYTGSSKRSLPYRFSWDNEEQDEEFVNCSATFTPRAVIRLRSFDEGTRNTVEENENDKTRQLDQQLGLYSAEQREKFTTVLPQDIMPKCTERWECHHTSCGKMTRRQRERSLKRNPVESPQVRFKKDDIQKKTEISQTESSQQDITMVDLGNSPITISQIGASLITGRQKIGSLQMKRVTVKNDLSARRKTTVRSLLLAKFRAERSECQKIRSANTLKQKKQETQELSQQVMRNKNVLQYAIDKRQSKKNMLTKQKVQQPQNQTVQLYKRGHIKQKTNEKKKKKNKALLENIEQQELLQNPTSMTEEVRKLTLKHIDQLGPMKRMITPSPCSRPASLQQHSDKKTEDDNSLRQKQIRITNEHTTLFDDTQMKEELTPQQLYVPQQSQQPLLKLPEPLQQPQQLSKLPEPLTQPQQLFKLPEPLQQPQQLFKLPESHQHQQLFKRAKLHQMYVSQQPQQLFKLPKPQQTQKLFRSQQQQQPQEWYKSQQSQLKLFNDGQTQPLFNNPKQPQQSQQLFEPQQPQQLFKPQQPQQLFKPQQPQQLYKPQQPQQLFKPQQPQQLFRPQQPQQLFKPEPSHLPQQLLKTQQTKLIGEILILNEDARQEKKQDSNGAQHGDKKSKRPQNMKKKLRLPKIHKLRDKCNQLKQVQDLFQQSKEEMGNESSQGERSMVAIGSLNDNGITRSFYVSSELVPNLLELLPPSDNLKETRMDPLFTECTNIRPGESGDHYFTDASLAQRPRKVSRKTFGDNSAMSLNSRELNNALSSQDLTCYEQLQESEECQLGVNVFDRLNLKVNLINKHAMAAVSYGSC